MTIRHRVMSDGL